MYTTDVMITLLQVAADAGDALPGVEALPPLFNCVFQGLAVNQNTIVNKLMAVDTRLISDRTSGDWDFRWMRTC
ncbi:hypothetical protein A3197_11085 [Candidatus Thiodiazotropha endoloripes]|nr:hypothetical protein A3197_11085 [Candidatus Thiodiazotropha endoloripes]